MFARAFLTAVLVASAASLYVDEYRQAPVTIRPEITQINRFLRISTLEPEDPPYPPQPKVAEDEFPPINPKGSGQASCGITKFTFTETNQTETLTSQRYPWDYPKNQSCNYTLNSPPGTQNSLECDTFHVACPKDQFAFSLDGGQTFRSYCGRGVLPAQTTTGNSLIIRFTSDKKRSLSLSRYRYKCTITSIGTESGSGSTTTESAPVDPEPATPEPAAAALDPSTKAVCSCGVRNINGATRIVGGIQTKAGELPWRVTVFVYDPSTGRGGICGGTIISNNWVLTAAHCTMDFKSGNRINVYVGAQANPVTVGGGTAVPADRYVQHPAFNRNTLNNDIALLHLSKPLTFKSNVSPVCLPFPYFITFSGLKALASSWGTTKPVPINADNNDPVSDTLREVELPVLSTAECNKYKMGVSENMICTYLPGKDTCQGDSGGSIDTQNSKDKRYYSIGVVSYGYGCAQEKYPGVYTKVTKYLDWIKSTTQDTFCTV